ncbi:uncharacterized protein LOC116417332 [Nasonia vitripennis]|uniref:Uncharacterized protein n=1 Tax=Nasonia vitripennis TaxID=7425 RepID=A0A7M7QDM3_NASVI|nr:uncharacterized protein LOC116417332 [Nasonia vitripennis]
MYWLYFFRKSTNLRLRQHLVQALLFSIIDYCALAYCHLTQELDTKLQKLVNTGIRYIYGVRRDEHISPYRLPTYILAFFDFQAALRPVWGEVTPLDIPSFKTKTLKN